jgi:hypothetical protein
VPSAPPSATPTATPPVPPTDQPSTSFCEIRNQGNVLTAGLRGFGDACLSANVPTDAANVPTDACPSTMSVSGIEENYIQPLLRLEEFGRQSFEYLEFLDAQPPAWYQPHRFEGLKPPTSKYEPVKYKFGCIGGDQTACLDGNLIRYVPILPFRQLLRHHLLTHFSFIPEIFLSRFLQHIHVQGSAQFAASSH